MAEKSVQCVVCGQYSDRTFVCNRCRRRPICVTHRDTKLGFCLHCAAEIKTEKLNTLRPVATSLSVIMNLLEFIFIVTAIFFAALRFIPGYVPPYLKDNIFANNLYLWGGLSAVGTALLCIAAFIVNRQIRSIHEALDTLPSIRRGSLGGGGY